MGKEYRSPKAKGGKYLVYQIFLALPWRPDIAHRE